MSQRCIRAVISGGEFSENVAPLGAAVYIGDDSELVYAIGATFRNNTAPLFGDSARYNVEIGDTCGALCSDRCAGRGLGPPWPELQSALFRRDGLIGTFLVTSNRLVVLACACGCMSRLIDHPMGHLSDFSWACCCEWVGQRVDGPQDLLL
eukprot:56406-Chlamydomonas_euryale.AAC.1